jgi:hypothetical protein
MTVHALAGQKYEVMKIILVEVIRLEGDRQ